MTDLHDGLRKTIVSAWQDDWTKTRREQIKKDLSPESLIGLRSKERAQRNGFKPTSERTDKILGIYLVKVYN